jgi:hypothetical protein
LFHALTLPPSIPLRGMMRVACASRTCACHARRMRVGVSARAQVEYVGDDARQRCAALGAESRPERARAHACCVRLCVRVSSVRAHAPAHCKDARARTKPWAGRASHPTDMVRRQCSASAPSRAAALCGLQLSAYDYGADALEQAALLDGLPKVLPSRPLPSRIAWLHFCTRRVGLPRVATAVLTFAFAPVPLLCGWAVPQLCRAGTRLATVGGDRWISSC